MKRYSVDEQLPRLILIRHSEPVLDFSVPASRWKLSDFGRQRALEFAPLVGQDKPAHIYAGPEPKMAETASIIGNHVGVDVTKVDDLSEHRRPRLPERGQDEWHSLIEQVFARPNDLVLGLETGSQCLARFSDAVEAIAKEHPAESFAVVSGATAISLYLAHGTGKDTFAVWRSLDMPDVVVTEHPATMT